MAEYIKRDVAKDELLSWAVCIKHPEHLMKEDAMHILDSIPAADVVEVKHGRWLISKRYEEIIEMEVVKYTCSVCNEYRLSATGLSQATNYCPACGARMDGADVQNT